MAGPFYIPGVMSWIDAHAHLAGNHPDTVSVLGGLALKVVNIALPRPDRAWRPHAETSYRDTAARWPDRFAWVTTFDLPDWEDPAWAEKVIHELDRDFAAGAVGCKVWKNIGMQARRTDGGYLMIDDPVFTPVFNHLARLGRPLLTHVADPIEGWLPLDERSPHYQHYTQHPEWHMHGRPDAPTHAELMAARDRVLARHRGLRVIGAHLGSLSHDLRGLAQRLDEHPNFAVDTSARVRDIIRHDRDELLAFLTKYQDRVLWGSDLICVEPHARLEPPERSRQLALIRAYYQSELMFYQSGRPLQLGPLRTHGLDLPAAMIEKLFRTNARTWYPGL